MKMDDITHKVTLSDGNRPVIEITRFYQGKAEAAWCMFPEHASQLAHSLTVMVLRAARNIRDNG